MQQVEAREICQCGAKSVGEAIDIFSQTTLPYKKAKKLVTGCSKSCCRRPLMALFKMVEFGDIDYEEIDFLIEQFESKFVGD